MIAFAVTAAPSPAGPMSPPISPGSILAQKYRVERVLGQGGMGIVVEAKHIALDERVALKFLLPDYAAHEEAAARFLREARAAVKIKSEHVCRVSDVGTFDNDVPYMVMEFLDGTDLAALLKRQGVLSTFDAIDFVIQGCEAIAEAHAAGIVHRDIKPANLFLTKRPDGSPLIKVLDFGISKMAGESVDSLTRSSIAMGSALYMSPEQMQHTRSVDHRTDIYALGIALFELLAGRPPFFAETLPQLCAEVLTGVPTPLRTARPDIPEDLAARIERAYQRDRDHRYASVAELVIALAPYAPPRSRGTIDRIARMGGLMAPSVVASHAGAGAAVVSPIPGVPPARGSWPDAAIVPPGVAGVPARHGSWPDAGVAPPGAAGPAAGRGSSPDGASLAVAPRAMLVGAYAGPASAQAASAFATQGGSTNTALATGGSPTPPATRRPVVLAALALGALLGLGGAVAVFVVRAPGVVTSSKATATAEAATASPTAPDTAPPATSTGAAAQVPGEPVAAAESASAPVVAASNAPSSSSAVPAVATSRNTSITRPPPKGTPGAAPPDKPPPGPTRPNDVFEDR